MTRGRMFRNRAVRTALTLAALVALSGCASLPGLKFLARRGSAVVTPVQTASAPPRDTDTAYAGATAAIGRRDYARALELLQIASIAKGDDPRVLNAFGVVYDKLGRFDLSARYYAQALTLDPRSTIVAQNLAYSARMRSDQQLPVLARQSEPSAPFEARAPVVRLAFAEGGAIQLGRGLTGRAVQIADASGAMGGAEPVRTALVTLGWSVAGGEHVVTHVQAASSITYPTHQAGVAKALERTLPGPVKMIECGESCTTIRLAVGSDARDWFHGAAAPKATKVTG